MLWHTTAVQVDQTVAIQPSEESEAAFSGTDWALFVGVSLIWGSSFLLIAMALEGLTPGAITFLRVGLGALALWVTRLLPAFRHSGGIDPGDRSTVFVLSVVWVAIPFTLFPLAQQYINSALTGLLNGSTPVFAAAVSILLTRRLPGRAQIAGMAIGLLGLLLLSWPSLSEGSSEARGVVMVVAATVCYGVSLNLAAPLQRRYGAITLMSRVLTLATVWLIPIGLRDLSANVWSADVVIPVVLLGVVGTGFAYWLMATLVGRVGSVRASFITYLIPVVSLVLGVAILADRVAGLALIGAALITAGAFMASRRTS